MSRQTQSEVFLGKYRSPIRTPGQNRSWRTPTRLSIIALLKKPRKTDLSQACTNPASCKTLLDNFRSGDIAHEHASRTNHLFARKGQRTRRTQPSISGNADGAASSSILAADNGIGQSK